MYCARCKKLVSEQSAIRLAKQTGAAFYCPECKRRLLYLGQEKGFVSSRAALEKYDQSAFHLLPKKLQHINFERSTIETRIDELLDVLKYAPDNVNARFDLGLIYYSQKQLELAMACFQKVLELMPHHRPTLHKLLNICTADEAMEKAITIAQQMIVTDPNDAEILFHLALLYLNTQQVDEAEALLQRLIEVDPQHPEANQILEALKV